MVPAFQDLQVRPAGQGDGDLNPDFARLEGLRNDVMDLKIVFTVKNGGFHFRQYISKHEIASGKS